MFDYTIQDDTKYELFVSVMKSDEFIQGMVDILSKHLELIEKGDYNKDALNKMVEDYLSSIDFHE